ncbi:MAG: HU family DNA-binding protein, partial [Nitrospirae bacterium]|nr:HU family DNA-binding protein [Nitrospirota bacterium]
TIKDALLTGESVKIVGFGTFNVRKKSSRIGRNPKTMATFEISPRKVITFKPSNKLRRAMAKG